MERSYKLVNGAKQEKLVEQNLIKISFDKFFAPCTALLPLGSMIFCFTTAVIFQFDQVNKTFCPVSVHLHMYF